MPKTDFRKVFKEFNRLKVLVVGDVMVDAYLFGQVTRISPEAPVPIVNVEKRLNMLGGAANVALNIKAMGAIPVLCSVIGNDRKGDELLQLLEEEKMMAEGLVRSPHRITTTKFRVIGNKAQLLRVDEEISSDLEAAEEQLLLQNIKGILSRQDVAAVIFQDYNKGVLTEKVIREATAMAAGKNIPVVVDPKKRNFTEYEHATLFKPNLKELREGLNMDIHPADTASLEKAAGWLHENMHIRLVMATLSEAGVFISEFDNGQATSMRIPAHIRTIADVSGAGDTVVSLAALCLAAGLAPHEIASVSNLGGGMVCEHVGVVPVDKKRLLAEVLQLQGG